MAALSRASAGVCGNTIIVNLPGNPSGASEVVEILFPLLLHAVRDINLI
jgi:gephyrin